MSWVEETAIYCRYRPDQGLWPNQQKRSIHSPAKDRMPVQAPKYDNVFPWRYARNRLVGRLSLRPLPNQERSETGLCTRTHSLRHLFFASASWRFIRQDCCVLDSKKRRCSKALHFQSLADNVLTACWTYLLDCRLREAHMTLQGTYTFSL